jgi:hypothetical protein
MQAEFVELQARASYDAVKFALDGTAAGLLPARAPSRVRGR